MSTAVRVRLGTALAALGLLVTPAGATAHAVLEQSDPARGAALERAPEQVTLRFDEPVEAGFGGVRVYDSEAERVDSGELVRPGDSSDAVGTTLEPGLADGTYTATYRVVSADSHPVSGGFVFTIGDPSRDVGAGVGELIESAEAGPVTEVAFGVARVASYVGTALVIGGIVFILWCWRPALATYRGAGSRVDATRGFIARMRGLLAVGLAVGILGSVAGLALQGAVALGDDVWAGLDPDVFADVLGTRFGTAWGLRIADLALVGALCLLFARRARPPGPLAMGAVVLGLAYLALVPALAGHPGVTEPEWLSIGLSFVHVLAFAAWLGGLAALLFAVRAATGAMPPADRSALLAPVLGRFSGLALVAVGALLATGIGQSVLQLEALSELVETGYGRAILAKALLLAVLVGLGAFNRRRSLPSIRARAAANERLGSEGVALKRVLTGEVALIAAVLVATAVLAATAPDAGSDEGPFSGAAELGSTRVDVTVDPGSVGANEIHLYLFDGQTGAQFDESKEFTVDASLPAEDIGPLELDVRKAGPGHYVVRAAPLGVPGEWTLELGSRVSAFELHRAAIEVPVR